jgi:two-component system response regulator (stage 0 sporulation protein A)
MSKKISIMIADDNAVLGDLIVEYLKSQKEFEVVGVARDGIQTVEIIQKQLPDVVLLDLIMPGIDGIGVLERVSTMQLRHRPSFIVLTGVGQEVFIQKAMTLGAEYYILKPFDIEILAPRILQAYSESHRVLSTGRKRHNTSDKFENRVKKPDSPEAMAARLMHKAGILPHIGGYPYLRDAVVMSLENSLTFNSAAKILYTQIASKYKTTANRVERAMRSAIYNAWDKGLNANKETANEVFIAMGGAKPTNPKFINTIADMVRKEMNGQ